MASFLFSPAKLSFLNSPSLFKQNLVIVPVEATPSTDATTYGAITGIATAVGGGSLVKFLLDIGGDINNRVLDDTANNRVALQFSPVDWGALDTTNAAPITGFVVVSSNSTSPNTGSLPIFYIALVDAQGDPQSFTPNGSDSLTINLAENPVGVREYGGNVFDLYLREWINGSRNTHFTAFSLIYCESAPNPTWSTVADITGRATLPGGGDLSSGLSDVDGTANRAVWVGGAVNGTAGYRFETVILPDFETLSGDNVTHYILAEGNPNSASSPLAGWGLINPALVATGDNDYRLNMIAGSTLTL